MKKATAFIRLIRYPNLLFIGLTQILFHYSIIHPAFASTGFPDPLDQGALFLIIAASVLIAAGGYVINDYFDLNIDRINKPEKLVVDSLISRRWAILLHLVLSVSGLFLTALFSAKTRNFLPFLFNIGAVLLLWLYSTSFKKQLLVGNVVISLLTGWVVLVLYVCVTPIGPSSTIKQLIVPLSRIYKFAALYGGFAFIISLVREVVKDMEDMEGDRKYDCRTMPIVWGIPATKLFVSVWLIVLICTLIIVQMYALQMGWWISVLYSILLLIIPLLRTLKLLLPAAHPSDFHKLSKSVKWVMFFGILSMAFFKWYPA